MKNINLDVYTPLETADHTSKGDQRKWRMNDI